MTEDPFYLPFTHERGREELRGVLVRIGVLFRRLGKGDDMICLFGVFRPTPEFFTHLETSSLAAKDCKF